MSPGALYVTYGVSGDVVEFLYRFYTNEGSGLVSDQVAGDLGRLVGLELSSRAKMVELTVILERYYGSLSDDDRLRIENEMNNRLKSFLASRGRELEKTGIVKVGLGDLGIKAQGEVPGTPLSQFSLDEYQGHLRVATTVAGGVMGVAGESANDVYVLDGELRRRGEVVGLGLDERIYAVRFMGERGYLVTFKQIDPFFVLDLSDPEKPTVEGELKIPGFSSYLHQLREGEVLGVGQEGAQVKLSLFDVRDAASPTERATYLLDEYWTEVAGNHHAFLQDEAHGVFFLPGGQGGYVFSYVGEGLELVKAVSETGVQRAVFIDDYLYVIGNEGITVLNESDWQEVNRLAW
jgi:uncharacterized secreted protein with C-terminal beta-propeller domain